jgi:hypothetical protein
MRDTDYHKPVTVQAEPPDGRARRTDIQGTRVANRAIARQR